MSLNNADGKVLKTAVGHHGGDKIMWWLIYLSVVVPIAPQLDYAVCRHLIGVGWRIQGI